MYFYTYVICLINMIRIQNNLGQINTSIDVRVVNCGWPEIPAIGDGKGNQEPRTRNSVSLDGTVL